MKSLAVVIAISAAMSAAQAQSEAPETEAGFRIQIGLTLVSGLSDLTDKIQRNNPNVLIESSVPLGLAFSARREFEGGLAAGFTSKILRFRSVMIKGSGTWSNTVLKSADCRPTSVWSLLRALRSCTIPAK